MSDMPAPGPGQIWQENDPRHERFVRVVAVHGRDVQIITINSREDRTPKKGARVSTADLFRFGSVARGKYRFIEAPAGVHQ
jgi:hypothetical protein